MKSVFILFDNIVNLYIWILIINVIMTWLVAFNILNTSNRFVYSVLDVSHKLTDPPLNFIRRYLPNLGSIDISPIILILGLMFLRNLVFEMFKCLNLFSIFELMTFTPLCSILGFVNLNKKKNDIYIYIYMAQ